jgi:hypothetical protein
MQEEAQRIQAQQAARNAQLAREQLEYSKNKDQRDFDYAKGQEERQTLANATAQIGEMEKKRRENEVSQGAKNEFQARYIELVDSDLPAAREMLEANKSDLVARFGYDFYKAMIANQDEFEAQAEAKKQQAEEGSKKPWYQFW